jgi:hypothetical protein
VAVAAAPARAQSTLGTIRGALRDDQGQPVPRARLRVVDENTGVHRQAETDAAGNFEVPNLRAGSYSVEDGSPGFVAFRRAGVVLRASETVRADLVLAAFVPLQVTPEPAASTPPRRPTVRIEVTADAGSSLQLESPAIRSGLEAAELDALPRGSRDFQDFLFLNPNVLDASGDHQFVGGRTYGVSYLQDGQPANGVLLGILTFSAPGLDALDEVKVLSNSYSAEFGGLAAVVVTTRRGDNRYRGSAFYDFNADEINALNYNQKALGILPQVGPYYRRGGVATDSEQHRYGLVLSGPVRRQKTFILAAFEGHSGRAPAGNGRIVRVPTEAMRAGDFSGATFRVNDPATGAPFPGNVIPPSRLHPSAPAILDFYYPPPNLGLEPSGFGRYVEFASVDTRQERVDLRLDHELGANDSAFLRFSLQDRRPGTVLENATFPRLGNSNRTFRSRTAAASWVRVLSPRSSNELRIGYNLQRSDRRSPHMVGELGDSLGIEVPAGARGRPGYPALSFSGSIASIGDNSRNADQAIRQSSFSVSDTLTLEAEQHVIKAGGLYSRDRVRDTFPLGDPGSLGQIAFNGRFTGNSLADLLLGLPSSSVEAVTRRAGNPLDLTSDVFAAFVQDDWKLHSDLTVFLGLRYEVARSFEERHDLIANLDPSSGRLIVPSQRAVSLVAQDVPVVVASKAGVGPGLVDTDWNNLSPRAGFAWRLADNRMVIRGGLGLFYPTAAAQGVRDALSREAFSIQVRRTNPTLAQAFSTGTVARVFPVVNSIDTGLVTPRFLQFNLTAEREIPAGIGLRASYLGVRQHDLIVNRFYNTPRPSTQPFDASNPIHRQRLPYPNLSHEVFRVENGGTGRFDALQIEARRRFSNGLAVDASYTLASSRSDAPDFGNSTLGIHQYDPYDVSKSRGPDPHAYRHRFLGTVTWEVPVGRDRGHLRRLPAWAEALIGGWTASSIVYVRSGPHLTPFFTGFAEANTGVELRDNDFGEAWRPDLAGDPGNTRSRSRLFDPTVFTQPAPGTTGNTPAGIVEGPGTWVVNLGLDKTIVKGRRFSVQFRATLENLFNHPQFHVEPIADPFMDVTSFLSPEEDPSSATAALSHVDVMDGFAPGRVVRLGLKAVF